jgi:C-terminal processing protease CtpA/Prc
MRMNRTAALLALILAVAAWGGTYAGGPGCCAGKNADCASKQADCAAKHADCPAMAGESAHAAAHECGMKAEDCAEYMKKDAETHGWLGVSLESGSEGLMSVTRIWPGSPAEKAGFQIGDQVVSMNGVEVSEKNAEKVHQMMRKSAIGDKVNFRVARGSNTFNLEAVLVKMPEEVLSETIDQHLKEHHKIAKS